MQSLLEEIIVLSRGSKQILFTDDLWPLISLRHLPLRSNIRIIRSVEAVAILSEAFTLKEVIQEMLLTITSERQGRIIDKDRGASMEIKKTQGYF